MTETSQSSGREGDSTRRFEPSSSLHMSRAAPRFYRPATALPRWMLAHVSAAAFGVVAAFMYVYLTEHSRWPRINALALLLFGAALAWIPIPTGTLLHERTRRNVLTLALAATVTGYLFNWWFWAWLMIQRMEVQLSIWEYIARPWYVFEVMQVAVIDGLWVLRPFSAISAGETAVNGGDIVIIWIVEFAVVFGLGLWLPYGMSESTRPRCASCRQPLTYPRILHSFTADAIDKKIVSQLEMQNWDFLTQLDEPTDYVRTRLRLQYEFCEHCGETCVLSLLHVKRPEGYTSKQIIKSLLPRMYISSTDVPTIEACKPRRPQ